MNGIIRPEINEILKLYRKRIMPEMLGWFDKYFIELSADIKMGDWNDSELGDFITNILLLKIQELSGMG